MYDRTRIPIDIHIGMEKTGSTSIQRYLYDNRQQLLKQYNILYPCSLGNNLSIHLAAACQKSETPDDMRKIRNLLTPDSINEYRETLQKQFCSELRKYSRQLQRIVISCEHFSSRLKEANEIQELKDFLQPFSDDLRIIVYLRRQDKFIISSYSTAVKAGRTTPFEFPRNIDTLLYSKLLDKWASVFGKSAIKVKLFERSHMEDGDVVKDFCKTLNLPGDLIRSDEHKNRSYNTNTLNFLREFNNIVPRFQNNTPNPMRGNIVTALERLNLPGSRFKGNADNVTFYKKFYEDNRAVAKKWFSDDPDIPDNLFAGTVKNTEDSSSQNFDPQELIEVSAYLWQFTQRELAILRNPPYRRLKERLMEWKNKG